MTTDFDYLVIGGGSGGVRSARIAAQHGARVAIAEEHRFGGTCVIRGCIPKKLMVYASELGHALHDAKDYGWQFEKKSFNWNQFIAAKDKEIDRLSGLYQKTLGKHNVTIFDSKAEFVDPNTVKVAGKNVTAKNFLVATGGWPRMPEIPGIEHAISSNEIFHLKKQPKHIVVVGGGYIGIEFAGILAGMGSEVTLVHRSSFVLRGFDRALQDSVLKGMENSGIVLSLENQVSSIEKTSDGLSVSLADGKTVSCDQVLFATGRTPNTNGLAVEKAGVTCNDKGAIVVNNKFQTSSPHIFAVGDVIDRVALTPVAIREGHLVADALFSEANREMDYSSIPTAVFSQPPAATVGLTESEAIDQFGDVLVFETDFRPLFHTLTKREERVMMKLVVSKSDDRVRGLHVVGEGAGDMAQIAAIAVKMGAKKSDFDSVVALHPCSAEEFVLMKTPRPGVNR